MQRTATYKAVCYKCSYVGDPGSATRCPVCDFPFILEAGATPEVAPVLEVIFDRTSVRLGAPPLPGVDATPRKAQLLMEARKRRVQSQRRATSEAEYRAARLRSRIKLGFVGVTAMAAGALAALLVAAL